MTYIDRFDDLLKASKEYEDRAEWQRSLRYLQDALTICEKKEIPEKDQRTQDVLFKMGCVYRRFGRYQDAENHLERALDAEKHAHALKRAEILGELGVVHRHNNQFEMARDAFKKQYSLAKESALAAEAQICRAAGNDGVSAYNLYQENIKAYKFARLKAQLEADVDNKKAQLEAEAEYLRKLSENEDILRYAIERLDERITRAQSLQDYLLVQDTRKDLKDKYYGSARMWETIGLDRLSLCLTASRRFEDAVTETRKINGQTKRQGSHSYRPVTLFHGRSLWFNNQRQEAKEVWMSKMGVCTPAMGLCKEPSAEHADYLQLLADAGIDFDSYDEQGFSSLDYAVLSQNLSSSEANEDAGRMINIIIDSFRSTLKGEFEAYVPRLHPEEISRRVEEEIRRRRRQADVRRYYRIILQEHMRPQLRNKARYSIRDLRLEYDKYLNEESQRQEVLDAFYYVSHKDFKALERMPRAGERRMGSTKPLARRMFEAKTDHASPSKALEEDLYIIFISYRWIGQENHLEGPDDLQNTQYNRILNAVDDLVEQKGLDPDSIGLWLDCACIDQEQPRLRERGIDTMPLAVLQCDAMISLEDDKYYQRAWCAVEVQLMQELIHTYRKHERWSHVLFSPEDSIKGAVELSEEVRELSVTELATTVESDLPQIDFLMRQSKLLGRDAEKK